ncbi:unnamed protein product [Mytilus coruscus]|uniref:Uncharacterized protein n=1 Tax=Mytilus coruscus TaxID=42192 RepID=A0A6J8BR16_MYTCO|nr:unnamed protein product [Mytilus coruscus]
MAKSYSCVLCNKTHLTVNNRRTIINEKLRDYLARTLKRNVENATVCLKCRAQVYRDMKTVMNSPQIRQGIATCQSNDDEDPDFLAEETLPSELFSPKSIQLNLSSTSKSHRRCTVCQKNSSNRHRQVVVPHEARTQAFIEKCIVIPANSRCCPNHLLGNYFTQESISKIPEVNSTTLFNRSDITELLNRVRGTLTLNVKLNFDCSHSLSEEDYQRLTGLTRNQFEAVANTVTDLRKSEIRSVKTCLAILLVKLRTGLSNIKKKMWYDCQ